MNIINQTRGLILWKSEINIFYNFYICCQIFICSPDTETNVVCWRNLTFKKLIQESSGFISKQSFCCSVNRSEGCSLPNTSFLLETMRSDFTTRIYSFLSLHACTWLNYILPLKANSPYIYMSKTPC